MSLKTWKKEFYPISASRVRKDAIAAIEHSLRKWRGLTKDQMKRHGVGVSNYLYLRNLSELHDPAYGIEELIISDDSCALCAQYRNYMILDDPQCAACPIKIAMGQNCWKQFKAWEDGNPRPMIALLERTLAHYTKPKSNKNSR